MSTPTLSRTATQFRSEHALSDDQIHRYAPSVFATEPHESRGKRYAFISTQDVLNGLRQNGFEPYEVAQTRVRDESKREHTKHLIRFRHPDLKPVGRGGIVGAEWPEIILLNSHDGTSAYRLCSGWFRLVCSNGMVSGSLENDIKVRHSGKVVNDVIEGAFKVIDDMQLVGQRVEEMKSITVDQREHILLAETARQIRWSGADHVPVEAQQLTAPKRFEDRAPDLWTRFNVVQENLLKGGVEGRTATNRRSTTRAVTGVTENVRVNRALWQMAEAFAGLKTGRVSPQDFQSKLLQQTPELADVV